MDAKRSLTPQQLSQMLAPLAVANSNFARRYPLLPLNRQPVHTVYGGANLFKSTTVSKLAAIARESFAGYAETPEVLESVFGLNPSMAARIHALVSERLTNEAVEDYRIDFEDGYGHRDDDEEDRHAAASALEMAEAWREHLLPAFCGMRVKGLSAETAERAVRTLDIFMTSLLQATGGQLPENFVITLPKIVSAAQVAAMSKLLAAIETCHGLSAGSLRLELMTETPQALFTDSGALALPGFIAAAEGRCRGLHLGAYDFSASLDIVAAQQTIDHPSCDFARSLMQVAVAGTGIWLSDGATNTLPVPLHRRGTAGGALTADQAKENRDIVHNAWRLSYRNVTVALRNGFYQGWDLHPNQIPVRYVALYAFYLSQLDEAVTRLRAFIETAGRASLVRDMFDDAATGQGLLNFFLRALSSGALRESDLQETGLTKADLQTRSFLQILKSRRAARGIT